LSKNAAGINRRRFSIDSLLFDVVWGKSYLRKPETVAGGRM
jgi:hypothetical protein